MWLQRAWMGANMGCYPLVARPACCQRDATILRSLRAGAGRGHLLTPPREASAWSTRSMILLTSQPASTQAPRVNMAVALTALGREREPLLAAGTAHGRVRIMMLM